MTVLNEGRGGILGFGGGQARVLVRPVSDEDQDEDEEGEFDEEDDEDEDDEELEHEVSVEDDAGEDGEGLDEVEEAEADAPVAGGLSKAEAIDEAADTLQELLDIMGLDTVVEPRAPQTPGDGLGMVAAVLDVTGEDLGLLIGRRGETLASLQYLLNLVMRRRTRSHLMFGVDIEGYRRRREASLCGLARRMADRVRSSGQSVTLEPMPPAERRIVHIELAEDPDVLTVSIGEGDARKVAITPRR